MSNLGKFLILLAIISIIGIITLTFVLGNRNPSNSNEDELVFAHILFRHGDRNLGYTYPKDPWKNESFFANDELTFLGMRQQYELGIYLRKRYGKLIPTDGLYHPNDIYVRSTGYDRTRLSAAFAMAGMFATQDDESWNDTTKWQPIPINTVPLNKDYILAMTRPCPVYNKALEEYRNSNEINAIFESNQPLIQYLEQHTGLKINTIGKILLVQYVLSVEQSKNLTLPPWTDKVYFEGSDMEKLAGFAFSIFTNTKCLARLRAGFLIQEILGRFAMKVDSTLEPDRSLWVYSAHDVTLASVLNALGLFEPPHIPPYSSCIFFELHKFNGTFHVEIFYKRNHGDDKEPLEPLYIHPICGTKCTLTELHEIYQDVIPTGSFEAECDVEFDMEC